MKTDSRILELDIDSGSTFMGLIAQNTNEDAWDWAIEYVRNQCHDNESEYCEPAKLAYSNDAQARELVFFCQIFYQSDATRQEIRDILQLEFFESEYAESIKRIDKCGSGGNEECKSSDPDDFLDTGENTVCFELKGIVKD